MSMTGIMISARTLLSIAIMHTWLECEIKQPFAAIMSVGSEERQPSPGFREYAPTPATRTQ